MNAYDIEEDAFLRARDTAGRTDGPHLVSPAWLAARLGTAAAPVVLEVNLDPDPTAPAIPGALRLDWRRDLLDQQRRDVVPRDRFEQLLQSAGADDDSTVVFHGDCHNWFAAFGAWVAVLHGVRDVRLLDGGSAAWLAEDRPLTRRGSAPRHGTLTLTGPERGTPLPHRAFLSDVLAAAEGRSDEILLDVRSPEEYAGLRTAPPGEDEGAMRPGHVPGAISLPWGALVDGHGRFRPVAELRRILAARGIDGRRPIITYCRIGERSGHTWFALSRLLGWQVRNYDGSWAEYGNAIGVPIGCPG